MAEEAKRKTCKSPPRRHPLKDFVKFPYLTFRKKRKRGDPRKQRKKRGVLRGNGRKELAKLTTFEFHALAHASHTRVKTARQTKTSRRSQAKIHGGALLNNKKQRLGGGVRGAALTRFATSVTPLRV